MEGISSYHDEDDDIETTINNVNEEEFEEDHDEAIVDDLAWIASQGVAEVPQWELKVDIQDISKATTGREHSLCEDESESDDSDLNENDANDGQNEVSSSGSDDSDSSDDDTNDHVSTAAATMGWMTEEEVGAMWDGPPRTKNEKIEVIGGEEGGLEGNLTDDFILDPATDTLERIGSVLYKIDREGAVVIQASYTLMPLNEGSLLCVEGGKVIGRIHEVFGPVTTPFYTVRWAANKQLDGIKTTQGDIDSASGESSSSDLKCAEINSTISEEETDNNPRDEVCKGKGKETMTRHENKRGKRDYSNCVSPSECSIGSSVYCVKRLSTFVSPMSLIGLKGTDASNQYDEEVGEDEQDFSDDEAEKLYRQSKNRTKRGLPEGDKCDMRDGMLVKGGVGDAKDTGAGLNRKERKEFGGRGHENMGTRRQFKDSRGVHGNGAKATGNLSNSAYLMTRLSAPPHNMMLHSQYAFQPPHSYYPPDSYTAYGNNYQQQYQQYQYHQPLHFQPPSQIYSHTPSQPPLLYSSHTHPPQNPFHSVPSQRFPPLPPSIAPPSSLPWPGFSHQQSYPNPSTHTK